MGNCIGLKSPSPRAKADSVEVVVRLSPKGSSARKSSSKSQPGGGDSFVDVLFFPDRAMPCKRFRSPDGCTRKNCKQIHDEGSSLLSFLEYLANTKRSMDICVFTITCDEVRGCASACGGNWDWALD